MNPVDPTIENQVSLSNVNHEVPQIFEVNNEVPQDQPNMTSVTADASPSTDASPSAIGTKKLTYDVWNHFRRKKINGMDKAICNYCRIALTTNMWTASNQRKGFLALTAHFIDDNWTLQSRILRFAYVHSPHTSEVLANVIVKSMMDWNIDRNISTITIDNCSTNDSLINNVLHKLDHSTLMLGGSLFHMRCATHILNLVVQDSLDVIAPSLEMDEECLSQDMDLSGLLLLYLSPGDAEGIIKLASLAKEQGNNNIAFLCLLMLTDYIVGVAETLRGLRWCLGLKVETVTAQSATVGTTAVVLVVAATNRHCSV
ncbi:hypothetical protein ZIOFF_026914 [Zingiber officinale]|uniref:COPA/B TPR domain-containing protein n=1 Tax=Zingiber officinale TaxID=94328 RepID=A0A8J5H5H7_ZINOF|nr:hypothetical protein ZIOFF_026914 [Zingiber officinale]